MDKLDAIFNLQTQLNNRIGINAYDLDDQQRKEWILKFNAALVAEAGETWVAAGGKWWKQDQDVQWDHLKTELIDELHFLISKMILAGMTPEDIYKEYVKKNQINHERQDEGY